MCDLGWGIMIGLITSVLGGLVVWYGWAKRWAGPKAESIMEATERLKGEVFRLSGLVDEKVADEMEWKRFAISSVRHLVNQYEWKIDWDVCPPKLTPPES